MSELMTLTDDQVLAPVLSTLDERDAKVLVELKDELTNVWKTKQIFRTDTEAKYSVLNHSKFPTKASRYFQCVREMNMQFEQVMLSSFKLRRLQLDKQEKLQAIEGATGIEEARLKIDLDELYFSEANLKQQTQDRVRELKMWKELMDENNDGSFNTQDVNESQLQSLELQLHNRAKSLTEGSSPSEIQNVLGPLSTIMADKKPVIPKLNKIE